VSKSKRKPRGIVARFLAGEGISDLVWAMDWRKHGHPVREVEAILRRALKEAGVTGHHEHRFITDEDGAVHGCRCGKAYVDGPLKKARKR